MRYILILSCLALISGCTVPELVPLDSECSPPKDISHYIAALTLLKDWANSVITVQSGLIAVTGALLKDVVSSMARRWAVITMSILVVGIVFGSNVVGSLPIIAQNLRIVCTNNIYSEIGNLGFPLGFSTTLFVFCFVAGLIAFAIFVIKRSRCEVSKI